MAGLPGRNGGRRTGARPVGYRSRSCLRSRVPQGIAGKARSTGGETRVSEQPRPLTFADLAARWQIIEDEARHRVKHFDLPGFNVGTARKTDWRFRLATVEAWEAANERALSEGPPPESLAVRPG